MDTLSFEIKIDDLKKNVDFIKKHHNNLINELTNEIDQLKHKKRELQFCLLEMIQDRNPTIAIRKKKTTSMENKLNEPKIKDVSVMTDSFECPADKRLHLLRETEVESQIINTSSNTKDDLNSERLREIRTMFLEEETEEYKRLIFKIKSENEKLRRIVKYKQPSMIQRMNMLEVVEEDRPATAAEVLPLNCEGLPFEVTLDPFLIHEHPPHTPNLQECKLILNQLAFIHHKQRHELNQLNSDLHDVLSSKILDANAFMLARKYVPKQLDCNPSSYRIPLVVNQHSLPNDQYNVTPGHIHSDFKTHLPSRNLSMFRSSRQQKTKVKPGIDHKTTN